MILFFIQRAFLFFIFFLKKKVIISKIGRMTMQSRGRLENLIADNTFQHILAKILVNVTNCWQFHDRAQTENMESGCSFIGHRRRLSR